MTDHGTCGWSDLPSKVGISASSAALTLGWSAGLSRNQRNQNTHQMTPSTANISKARRQFTYCSTRTSRSGATAPPQRADIHRMPCARTRSSRGSQRLKARAMFGKQPASPAPNRKRTTKSDQKLQTQPVAAVKNDHHSTTRIRTRRAPILSPR